MKFEKVAVAGLLLVLSQHATAILEEEALETLDWNTYQRDAAHTGYMPISLSISDRVERPGEDSDVDKSTTLFTRGMPGDTLLAEYHTGLSSTIDNLTWSVYLYPALNQITVRAKELVVTNQGFRTEHFIYFVPRSNIDAWYYFDYDFEYGFNPFADDPSFWPNEVCPSSQSQPIISNDTLYVVTNAYQHSETSTLCGWSSALTVGAPRSYLRHIPLDINKFPGGEIGSVIRIDADDYETAIDAHRNDRFLAPVVFNDVIYTMGGGEINSLVSSGVYAFADTDPLTDVTTIENQWATTLEQDYALVAPNDLWSPAVTDDYVIAFTAEDVTGDKSVLTIINRADGSSQTVNVVNPDFDNTLMRRLEASDPAVFTGYSWSVVDTGDLPTTGQKTVFIQDQNSDDPADYLVRIFDLANASTDYSNLSPDVTMLITEQVDSSSSLSDRDFIEVLAEHLTHTLANLAAGEQTNFTLTDYSPYTSSSLNMAPVIANSSLVLVINNGYLMAFDYTTATLSWSVNQGFIGQPSVANGVVYALTNDSEACGSVSWCVLAIDLITGNDLTWQFDLPVTDATRLTSPFIVTDSHLFISSEEKTYAVNLDVGAVIDGSYTKAGSLSMGYDTLYIASFSPGVKLQGRDDNDFVRPGYRCNKVEGESCEDRSVSDHWSLRETSSHFVDNFNYDYQTQELFDTALLIGGNTKTEISEVVFNVDPTSASDLALTITATVPADGGGTTNVPDVTGEIEASDVLTYTVTVVNNGKDVDFGTLSGSLPAEADIVALPSECSVDENADINCDLGVIANGGQWQGQISIDPRPGRPAIELTADSENIDFNSADNVQTYEVGAVVSNATLYDLVLRIDGETDGTATQFRNQTFTFEAVVSNNSSNGSGETELAFSLPVGGALSALSVDPAAGSCSFESASCSFDDVPANGSFTITGTMSISATGTGALIGAVSSGSETATDEDASNNSATLNYVVNNSYDLSASFIDQDLDTLSVGESAIYTINVSNQGDDVVSAITLTATRGTNLSTVAFTSDTMSCNASTLVCTLDSLDAGGEAAVTFEVEVVDISESGLGELTVSIESDEADAGDGRDSNAANDTDSVSFAVGESIYDLGLSFTADLSESSGLSGSLEVDDTFTYSIVMSNTGVDEVSQVTLDVDLSSNLSATAFSSTAIESCDLDTLVCTVDTFASGASALIELVVAVTAISDGTGTIFGTVSSAEASNGTASDSNAANDSFTSGVVITESVIDRVEELPGFEESDGGSVSKISLFSLLLMLFGKVLYSRQSKFRE